MGSGWRLERVAGTYAVCRLDSSEPVPPWANSGAFISITRTPQELSVVVEEGRLPPGVRTEGGFAALRVAGSIDFSLTGVLSTLTVPLAEAGVSLFAISTYDTDYLFVRRYDLETAIAALRSAGHEVR